MAERILLPDVALLKQRFAYSSDTGVLRHMPRPQEEFKTFPAFRMWNARCSGKPAGTPSRDGRIYVVLDKRRLQASRVAYKIHYGVEPPQFLDHINGDPSDNRIANLRAATHAENMRNSRKRLRNSTGYKGVFWDKRKQKYVATLRENNKSIYLGAFETPQDAYAAYVAAAKQRFGEFFRPD